jgi:hypothetical protein
MLYLPFHQRPTRVTYEVKNGLAIYQGDIVLGPANDLSKLRKPPARRARPAPNRPSDDGINSTQSPLTVITESEYYWPGGIIPFAIDASLPASAAPTIRAALRDLEYHAGLRFPRRRASDPDSILFVPETDPNACGHSPVGRQGGVQRIMFDPSCAKGSVIHEVMHSLGMYHEQSRTDRDDYVEILEDNIKSGYKQWFEIEDESGRRGPYDFNSIMHYSSTAFAKKDPKTGARLTTIRSKVDGKTIQRGSTLSATDAEWLRKLYFQKRIACTKGPELFEHSGYRGGIVRVTRNQPHLGRPAFDRREFNDKASSLCVPTGWTVTLYEHSNYGGRARIYRGPRVVGRLGSLNDRVTSVQVVSAHNLAPLACKDQPQLFRHSGYAGRQVRVASSISNLHSMQAGDEASSVCVPQGWTLTLHENPNYLGSKVTLRGPIHLSNLHRELLQNWGDRVSSVAVASSQANVGCGQTPALFEHSSLRGRRLSVSEQMSNLHHSSVQFGDRASSVCVPQKWAVELYEHAGFQGRRIELVGPRTITALQPEWNDRVSSVRVRFLQVIH